jgi:hypothetical protein
MTKHFRRIYKSDHEKPEILGRQDDKSTQLLTSTPKKRSFCTNILAVNILDSRWDDILPFEFDFYTSPEGKNPAVNVFSTRKLGLRSVVKNEKYFV